MQVFNIFCEFLEIFLTWCAIPKVKCAPLNSDSLLPLDRFYYEKERNPVNFMDNYNLFYQNIKENMEKYYNESDVVVSFSEDQTDLNKEFTNETLHETELLKNGTDSEVYLLRNDKFNQSQSLNNSNYLLKKKGKVGTKQLVVHREGKSKNSHGSYRNNDLYKNITIHTHNDNLEELQVDKKGKFEKSDKKEISMGNFKYNSGNISDSDNQEKSEYFTKRKHVIKYDNVHLEKLIQGSKFNLSKKIDQVNDKRRSADNERIAKSHIQKYQKDNTSGLETLEQKCLNHLRQENVYKDANVEMKYLKNSQVKKKSFLKKSNGKKIETNVGMDLSKFLQNCREVLADKADFVNFSLSDGNKTGSGFSDFFESFHKISLNDGNKRNDDFKDTNLQPNSHQNDHQQLDALYGRSNYIHNISNFEVIGSVGSNTINEINEVSNEMITTLLPSTVEEFTIVNTETTTETNIEASEYIRIKSKFKTYNQLKACDNCDDAIGNNDCYKGEEYLYENRRNIKQKSSDSTMRQFPSVSKENESIRGNFTNNILHCNEGDEHCIEENYDYYDKDEGEDEDEYDFVTTESFSNFQEITTQYFLQFSNENNYKFGNNQTTKTLISKEESSKSTKPLLEDKKSNNAQEISQIGENISDLRRTIFGSRIIS